MSSWLTDVFGDTPQVAPYIKTDYTQEQLDALNQNIGAWPQIQNLGNLWQNYMYGGIEQAGLPIRQLMRTGAGLIGQEQAQAAPMLRGQIPPDVQSQIYRSGAFQNLMAGTAGSPMGAAGTTRSLGLTSLDMINRGAGLEQQAGNAAQRWQGMASGMMMNPSSMMVTPQQRAALDMQNRLYAQATKQLRYNLAAAPNPVAAGVSGTLMNLLGAYLGHGMGGGGNITPSYSSIMGGAGGTAGAMGGPSGMMAGMGAGMMGGFGGGSPYYGMPQQNPGFGANFSAGVAGQPTQGLGGTLGTWWGNLFGHGGG